MNRQLTLARIRKFTFRNATRIFIFGLAIFILVRMPLFFTRTSLMNLASQATIFGMAAIGLMFVILMGEIDISLGSVIYLSGVLGVRAYYATGQVAVSIIVGIATGLVFGFVNGFLNAKLRLPSMVLTMSTQFIGRGIGNLVIGADAVINVSEPDFQAIGQGKIFGFPTCTLFLIAAIIIGWFVLNKTKYGRYVYAVGDNSDALKAAGVNVSLVRITSYMIAGFLAGLAGVINVSRVGGSSFGLAEGLEFTCIACCVVGGASLKGGVGKIQGTLLGIIVIASINQLLRLFNVSTYLIDLVWGVVVVLTVAMDTLKNYQIRYEKEHELIYSQIRLGFLSKLKAKLTSKKNKKEKQEEGEVK